LIAKEINGRGVRRVFEYIYGIRCENKRREKVFWNK